MFEAVTAHKILWMTDAEFLRLVPIFVFMR